MSDPASSNPTPSDPAASSSAAPAAAARTPQPGAPQPAGAKPAVILISSIVARGGVGTRVMTFTLERLGHRVWQVPTIFLPWHPGHGRATRIVPPDDAFAAALADLARAPWLAEVGAVISGYLGSAAQAEAVAGLVAALKAANPAALYVCDPVVGDEGGLYVPEATATAVRDVLLPIADVATPNVFELGWATGRTITTPDEAANAARALGPARVLATSAPAMMKGALATIFATPDSAYLAEHPRVEGAPNGVGDLICAMLTDALLSGAGAEAALTRAASTTYEMVVRSVKAGADELVYHAAQEAIVSPAARVQVRRLATASPRRVARPLTGG
ncbi:pyridoxal kinase [Rhizobiales bacterium Sp-1]|uniref:pyridoxal kinase n=1 Tax=Segnochrobactrum spirostomi TaxID=2608987 RepID=A0A6A7Y311_9HYPH|nr:pyridoxal kinase [Segnochrobactrum spirostomi]